MSLEPPTVSEAENAVPFPASAPELRTPAEWSALDGVTVMDPDGWRGSKTLPAKSWDEPISRDEWTQRLSVSTQSLRTTPTEAEASNVTACIAAVLREHRRATGMAVTMGWTCQCGHWASGKNGEMPSDHQAAEIAKLFPDVERSEGVSSEYELRHPDGETDTFTDIGDAVDFQEQQFPDSKLFRREVTTTVVRGEWTEVPA